MEVTDRLGPVKNVLSIIENVALVCSPGLIKSQLGGGSWSGSYALKYYIFYLIIAFNNITH